MVGSAINDRNENLDELTRMGRGSLKKGNQAVICEPTIFMQKDTSNCIDPEFPIKADSYSQIVRET